MSIVFLNGQYLPMNEARISPMDRGFLFGDGIYEVVPSYSGNMVGFIAHIERMIEGLGALEITLPHTLEQWREICDTLIDRNGRGNLGLYLQVSRGADQKRFHAYPDNIEPTVFGFAFDIPPAPEEPYTQVKGYRVTTATDLRWQRCNIKSTALLGNVMHFQQGYAAGKQETLLFNEQDCLTEASACNAYIVKQGVIATPPLDHQILPGVTRKLLLDILRQHSDIEVQQRPVSRQEVMSADEVWLTSSSKEIAPVIDIDGHRVGNGEPGAVWRQAQTLFSQHKFDY